MLYLILHFSAIKIILYSIKNPSKTNFRRITIKSYFYYSATKSLNDFKLKGIA